MSYTPESLVREIARMDPEAPDYEETLRTLIGEARKILAVRRLAREQGAQAYTVAGLIDIDSGEFFTAGVFPGELQAADQDPMTGGFTRYCESAMAGSWQEAEQLVRVRVRRQVQEESE